MLTVRSHRRVSKPPKITYLPTYPYVFRYISFVEGERMAKRWSGRGLNPGPFTDEHEDAKRTLYH